MRTLVTMLAIGLAVSFAAAAPIVTGSHEQVAEGVYGVTFNAADALEGSWAMNLTFTALDGGTIGQHYAFEDFGGTTPVDLESVATSSNGMGGYFKAEDSWVYSPFAGIGAAPQISEVSDTEYYVHAGTPGGTLLGAQNLAYIVLEGSERLQYAGTISRDGVDYAVNGIYSIPEPATMSLIALGGLVALRRRRK